MIQSQIDEVDAAHAEQLGQELEIITDATELDASQEALSQDNIDPFSEPPSVGIKTGKTVEAGAITLGSQQPPLELRHLESLQDRGPIFRNFQTRLSAWLTDSFKAYNYKFPPGCDRIKLQGTDKVSTAFGYTGRVGSWALNKGNRIPVNQGLLWIKGWLTAIFGLPALQSKIPSCRTAWLCHCEDNILLHFCTIAIHFYLFFWWQLLPNLLGTTTWCKHTQSTVQGSRTQTASCSC